MIARTYRTFARILDNGFQDFISASFPFWQRLGLHVTPNHFYYPIPDTAALPPELWERRSELPGIDINEPGQFALLSRFVSDFKMEYDALPRHRTSVSYQWFLNNEGFTAVDGEVLYSMIRHFKPSCVFEIGSGNTTNLAAQAALKNREETGKECAVIACEPYPNAVLKAGFPGLTSLRATAVQNIPLAEFEALKESDILFIDSSHILKIGSEVQYEFLEILPRLGKGVVVHVHDIFMPAEYPKDWILKRQWFWNEQYLLQAFLSFNDSFEVLWASSYMHLNHPEKLEQAFASYTRDAWWPGSFWMRKTK